ncbi:MAG: PRC-barrel domain-containing protein, partial [Longimicrobiales bacterium]
MVLRAWNGETALLAENAFDVRDWSVRTLIDNACVGRVHQLLIDERAAARYLDIALETAEKHILIPIGQGRADRANSLVWLPGCALYQIESLPSYTHSALTRGTEARLWTTYCASLAGAMPRRGYRVLSEVARRRPAASDPRRLVPLSKQTGLRVASGEADPRHWTVIDRAGTVRGAVADLLVDLAAMKVRYVVCDLAADEGDNRCVLVPVEFLRLDRAAATGALPAFSTEQWAALPTYAGTPPDSDTEARILERFADAQEADDFYCHPSFSAATFFST